ncbi:C4-dicarboxylate ABC transporter permease [Deltaproteobacteria bacterium]|nr:C4-dicarboxylate ABC transporter permease [Deltaproteobacteria bacterium]
MDAFYMAAGSTINPYALLMLLFGVVGGIVVGAIPGMTANMAVAIMTSLSFGMDSMIAIMLLIGVYFGSMYGGSIAAILLHIPGTPSAVMTTKDGYPMAQRGEAGPAIGIATFSSFSGGMISMILLIVAAPIISRLALRFSAPEYFALAVFGLSIVASLDAESLARGITSAILGVLICMVGMDPITGIQRFSFGIPQLSDGISFISVMIGLFGMSEILKQLSSSSGSYVIQKLSHIIPSRAMMRRLYPTILRSSLIGTGIGALPGAGGSIACFVAYDYIKRHSKNPEEFGTGIPEGIAAPESANNAVTGGALMPLLTLGVPGDSVTAIMLGAFILHKISPGATLFIEHPDVIYGIYISGILANCFMCLVGFAAAGFFARLISFPKYILLPVSSSSFR